MVPTVAPATTPQERERLNPRFTSAGIAMAPMTAVAATLDPLIAQNTAPVAIAAISKEGVNRPAHTSKNTKSRSTILPCSSIKPPNTKRGRHVNGKENIDWKTIIGICINPVDPTIKYMPKHPIKPKVRNTGIPQNKRKRVSMIILATGFQYLNSPRQMIKPIMTRDIYTKGLALKPVMGTCSDTAELVSERKI